MSFTSTCGRETGYSVLWQNKFSEKCTILILQGINYSFLKL